MFSSAGGKAQSLPRTTYDYFNASINWGRDNDLIHAQYQVSLHGTVSNRFSVVRWKRCKKASVNENTLLCFLRDLKGGLLKTHYVWYVWTPGTSCSKVGWLYLRFRLLWFPNSTRCLISTQYKSLEWSYLTKDKRGQIKLTTEKIGLPVGKYHRRLINLHFSPKIYR